MRYTLDYRSYYTSYPMTLKGYNDAIWISNTKDLKSISGYVFTLEGVVVSWKSFKHTCVARSIIKFEFALDKGG